MKSSRSAFLAGTAAGALAPSLAAAAATPERATPSVPGLTFTMLRDGNVDHLGIRTTGTPSGVIDGYAKEKQVWLKAGDRVRTSITKLRDLRFTVV